MYSILTQGLMFGLRLYTFNVFVVAKFGVCS